MNELKSKETEKKLVTSTEMMMQAMHRSLLHIDVIIDGVEKPADFNKDHVEAIAKHIFAIEGTHDELTVGFHTSFGYNSAALSEVRKLAHHIDFCMETVKLPWNVREVHYLESHIKTAELRAEKLNHNEKNSHVNLLAIVIGRLGIFELSGARPRVYNTSRR